MWQVFALVAALVFFHGSEFILAAAYMRNQLSFKSLLISWPYMAAMSCGLLEFAVESALLPAMKQARAISHMGLLLVTVGEGIRKTAMVTAASNFTHDIQTHKRPEHVLVTTGIYRWVRHPGYLGWFIWAVATQILLLNPICALGFAYVSWQFLSKRIQYEDWTLKQFFGDEYLEYARRTPSGLPFIR